MKVQSEEVIAAIQQLVVNVLDLPVPASGVNPDDPIAVMEIVHDGEVHELDSVDLVEIVACLESDLDANLLDDPEMTELIGAGTLRGFADYLIETFPTDKVRAFCDQQQQGATSKAA